MQTSPKHDLKITVEFRWGSGDEQASLLVYKLQKCTKTKIANHVAVVLRNSVQV